METPSNFGRSGAREHDGGDRPGSAGCTDRPASGVRRRFAGAHLEPVGMGWGSPVTNHLIEVSSDGGMSWKVAGGDVGRGTTATVSDLENGTTYLLRVRVVSGLDISRATTVQAGPVTMPGTPTDVMAVGGEGLLTLNWIRPADGGRAITGVWVELAPTDDGGWQSFVAGPLTTSASIGGLVPGREYRVRVSYGNEIGAGLVSGEVRVLVR